MLGLAGVYLVVRHKIALGGDSTALVAIVVALAGISVGTLYQKKYCGRVDLRTGAVVQFAACVALYAPIVALCRACARSRGRRRSCSRSAGR